MRGQPIPNTGASMQRRQAGGVLVTIQKVTSSFCAQLPPFILAPNWGVLTDGALDALGPLAKGLTSGTSDVVTDAVSNSVSHSPGFIVDGSGQAFPVPTGATGPTPLINDAGNQVGVEFSGGKGGANGQVSSMRVMDAVPAKGKSPGYPNGYVKYENSASPTPQAVDPYTGQTGSRATTHYPIKNN